MSVNLTDNVFSENNQYLFFSTYCFLTFINDQQFYIQTNNKVWWPRELNVLQLQKIQANRKSTSKSRKHLHQFDSRCAKCSQHKQIKNVICSAFLYLVVVLAFSALVLSN